MKTEFVFKRSLTVLISFIILLSPLTSWSKNNSYITEKKSESSFTLSENGTSSTLMVSSKDFPGVIRVLKLLQKDIENVTGGRPAISYDKIPDSNDLVIVGTIGQSELIDRLISENKIDAEKIKDNWENYIIQTVKNPFPNVNRALIIAGSDKRGTIFGMFDLSQQIGVSPWYWWADVPVKKKSAIYIKKGMFSPGEPKIKYRGIFINDEAPALAGWSQEKYGTIQFNHKLYEHVFELILRLKGNFLWPAMWGRAFYDDDPVNPELAEEYGIVIGTSHHEPMMRAHVEWQRYGTGPWNYEKNAENLRDFWRKGIERMGSNESIVTLAMRGDGDEAMSPDANVSLLQKIVEDQRKIITEVTKKDITEIPQVWALYKEVQEYYDKGMRVPEDVTLLLCDDNWGNIRKLPNLKDKPRSGGYGIYYHYDYVGGPRNYKWLNTNQIERVWEQMHLAYKYGADRIWIVNVGDIKPMEFPIDFFLDYAWNPEKISAEDLPDYYKSWAEEQFGPQYSSETAEILSLYTKYNSRRKPELLSPNTYSLDNYREAEKVVEDYNSLYDKAKKIYDSLPQEYKDSYYQLVLHPVEACSNLNELYYTVAKNRLYAEQKRNSTNMLAEKAKELYERDAEITHYYNKVMAGGKWDHMMDQTHIGYTYWQQPDENSMPKVEEITVPDKAGMGISVEGSSESFTNGDTVKVFPEFDSINDQKYYVDVFNRGKNEFKYSVSSDAEFVKVSSQSGNINTEDRLWVNINWDEASKGSTEIPLTIKSSSDEKVVIIIKVNNIHAKAGEYKNCFVENNDYVSIDAVNYSKKNETAPLSWLEIPNLGRTRSAITLTPVTASGLSLKDKGARLDYNIYLFTEGEVNVNFFLSPTLNYGYSDGLKFAVSIDGGEPQIINMHQGDTPDWKYPMYWNQAVANNIRIASAKFNIASPGKHVLTFHAIDAGIVLQKIVLTKGKIGASYLGPPESLNSAIE